MKKSLLALIILFILLTTYTPKFKYFKDYNLNIKKIIIHNNSIIENHKIKEKMSFLYNRNLFFLKTNDIEEKLKKETFIESFSIKKIYPKTIKLIIVEKTPIAILQKKREKFYISDKGSLINFKDIKKYRELPVVFGNGESFFSLYKDLENIKFPLEKIKSFYFFESGRWDLIMKDDKIIKLPTINYLLGLKNFILLKNDKNFNNYKIFDYRIKDQLILN